MNAQTSDKVSKIAARYLTLTADRLHGMTASDKLRRETAEDIRAMAASCLRQDETPGLLGRVKKALGL